MEKKTNQVCYSQHSKWNIIFNVKYYCSNINKLKRGACSFYWITAEQTDASNSQQLTVCFRWLDDDLHAHKDFIGFYRIPNISANTTEGVLQDVLISLELSLDRYKGQCFGGTSNMLGKNSSVATKIWGKQLKVFLVQAWMGKPFDRTHHIKNRHVGCCMDTTLYGVLSPLFLIQFPNL